MKILVLADHAEPRLWEYLDKSRLEGIDLIISCGDLPPTYFAFGTRDPFVREFEANIAALEKAGVEVEGVVLQGWPHGFGACGGWIDGYDAFLRRAFDAAQA